MKTQSDKSLTKSISRRLVVYMVLCSSMITLALTGFQLYRDYLNDVSYIENDFEEIKNVHLKGLTESVWAVDRKRLQTLAEGLFRLRDINYVEIQGDGGISTVIGKMNTENSITHKFPMIYKDGDLAQEIGNLTISADLNLVFARVLEKAIVILISNAIKTVLVATFMLALVNRIVIRHLQKISNYINSARIGKPGKPLTLDRNRFLNAGKDELNDVVKSVNETSMRVTKALTSLLEIETQYKEASNIANLGHWVYDEVKDNMIHCSDELAKIHGVSPDAYLEMVNSTEKDIERVHPHDRETYARVITDAQRDATPFNVEYRIIRPDGEVRHVREIGKPAIDGTGKLIQSHGTIQDITDSKRSEVALRKSESRLSFHLDNTPLAAIEWRFDIGSLPSVLRAVKWNNSAERIFGYTEEEVQGVDVMMLIIPEDVRPTIEQLYELFKKGGGSYSLNDNIRKDGTRITVEWNNTIFYDDDGNVIGLSSFAQDVTERLLLENQLRQSQRMEAVGQLTGGVAHDFNNLLAVMMGNLEFALDKAEDDTPVRKFIENALGAIDSGSALTQKLLSFSRQQTLSSIVLDVNNLIDDTITLLERTLGENITINTKFNDEKVLIKIDPSIFSNALLNLSLNARDAMPSGGSLSVTTSSINFDGEQIGLNQERLYGPHIMITVSDTGVGIDKEDIDNVMEPFFTTKKVGEGSGLGLSMVYGFIHQSNGHVGISSKKGEGTSITLYLPIAQEEHGEQESEPSSSEIIIENITILLVEDDPDVRKTTSDTLKHFGYKVIEAEDGPSALDILKETSEQIDLVFSDVVMPNNMSGLELAEHIATDYKDIKVLLTSGYPDKVAEHEDIQKLNIKLLAKPYKRAQLVSAIEVTML